MRSAGWPGAGHDPGDVLRLGHEVAARHRVHEVVGEDAVQRLAVAGDEPFAFETGNRALVIGLGRGRFDRRDHHAREAPGSVRQPAEHPEHAPRERNRGIALRASHLGLEDAPFEGPVTDDPRVAIERVEGRGELGGAGLKSHGVFRPQLGERVRITGERRRDVFGVEALDARIERRSEEERDDGEQAGHERKIAPRPPPRSRGTRGCGAGRHGGLASAAPGH